MKQYFVPLNVGHGVDLHDGRPVAPGERVQLSDEDALHPYNAELLSAGLLEPVSEKGEKIDEKATRATSRRHEQVAPTGDGQEG